MGNRGVSSVKNTKKPKSKFEMRVAVRSAMTSALMAAYSKAGVIKTWKECESEVIDALPSALQDGFNIVTDNVEGSKKGVKTLVLQYALAHFEELMSPYIPEAEDVQ